MGDGKKYAGNLAALAANVIFRTEHTHYENAPVRLDDTAWILLWHGCCLQQPCFG